MTFEQLKSFLAVVKHNHFTLASQELFYIPIINIQAYKIIREGNWD
ncbi:MAG: hypothetical protein V8S33_13745 [Intestinibacter bartlettii]